MERKIFLAAIALATSTAAMAADLPSRNSAPPPPMPPAFTWTGFYLGAQLGWAQTKTDYTAGAARIGGAAAILLPTLDKSGMMGGAFVGYNYQIGQLVLGGELDGAFLITGKERFTALTGDSITAHTTWAGSLRARLGYAMDRWLFYTTGGLAFASPKSTVTGTGFSTGDSEDVRWGWTLGAGVEYAFTNNWIAGLEYRYAQYEKDTFTYPVGIGGLGIVGFTKQLSTNQVSARLLYKF